METIKVLIGSVTAGSSSGAIQDTTREVEFTGELLADLHHAGEHKGAITDTRGTTEQLYRTDDGKLYVSGRDYLEQLEHYRAYREGGNGR